MPHALDFSWARPDPQAVKDAGFDGIIGYVGYDNTGKLLTKQDIDNYLAVGLSVLLVWELGNQHALAGYNAGVNDAKAAQAQADALGYTGTIYFVLEDPTKLSSSQWATVAEYAKGLNDAGIKNEIGGYGSKALLNHIKNDLGLIGRMWYVGPWGADWDGADLVQTYRQDMPEINGTPRNQYDEDFCPNDDWGQHPRPAQPAPAPDEEDELATSVKPHFAKLKGTIHIFLVQRDYASKRYLNGNEYDGYRWVNAVNGGQWLVSDASGTPQIMEYDTDIWNGIPTIGANAPS